MGFDAFDDLRVPAPTAKVDDGGFFAELARKQRADDRKLGLGSGVSVAARYATLDGTTYTGDGEGSAQVTDMPAGFYAVTARCRLTWTSALTDAFNLKIVADDGSDVVGAGSGSLAAGSTLDLDVTAPGFVTLIEGSTLTALPSLQGTDTFATQATTITAVRLGNA